MGISITGKMFTFGMWFWGLFSGSASTSSTAHLQKPASFQHIAVSCIRSSASAIGTSPRTVRLAEEGNLRTATTLLPPNEGLSKVYRSARNINFDGLRSLQNYGGLQQHTPIRGSRQTLHLRVANTTPYCTTLWDILAATMWHPH